MSIPNVDLPNQGGRFNTELGMLLLSSDVDRSGELDLKTLLGFLMMLFYDDGEGLPITGVPRSSLTDQNLTVTSTGDLTFDVGSGWGVVFDASQIGVDDFEPRAYQFVVIESTQGGALTAHDPTDPRIDLIAVKPARVEDVSVTRNIKDPDTGDKTPGPVNLRSRLSGDVVIITGSPAPSPILPVLPDGHILLSIAMVPATAGPTLFGDARPVVHVGPFMKGPPGAPQYLVDHVYPAGGASELLVIETAPVSLAVDVTNGRAVIDGVVRHYARETLTLATADPTDPRLDTIAANRDGTLSVVTGTPAPSPVAPPAGANAITIAVVTVNAVAVSVGNANISDERRRSWLDGNAAIVPGSIDSPLLGVTTTVARLFSYHGAGLVVHNNAGVAFGTEGPAQPSDSGMGIGTSAVAFSWAGRRSVSLPDGATVTQLEASFTPTNTATTCVLTLARVSRSTGVSDVMASLAYDQVGTGVQQEEDSTISNAVIDNANFAYQLRANVSKPAAAGNLIELHMMRIRVDTAQLFS